MKKRIWLFVLLGILVTGLFVLFFASYHRGTLAHKNEGVHINTYQNQAEQELKASSALNSKYAFDMTITFDTNVSWHHDESRSALDMYAEFFWADPNESIEEFSADIEYMILHADINGDPYEVRLEKGDDDLLNAISATDADGNVIDLSEKAPAERVWLADRYLDEVETAYEADALLPEYQSTAGMCDLNGKYANRWAEIADEYYNKLMAYEHDADYSTPFCTVEEFRTALTDMKADHEEYVEKEMAAYNTVLRYEYQGGTISGVISSGHRCSLEKEWALKILNICDMLGVE